MSQSPAADKLCTINSKDVMVFKEASDQTTNHQICLKLENMLIFLSKTYSLVLKKNPNIKASKFGHSPISLFNSSPSKDNKNGQHHPILFKQLGTKRWEINMIELVS